MGCRLYIHTRHVSPGGLPCAVEALSAGIDPADVQCGGCSSSCSGFLLQLLTTIHRHIQCASLYVWVWLHLQQRLPAAAAYGHGQSHRLATCNKEGVSQADGSSCSVVCTVNSSRPHLLPPVHRNKNCHFGSGLVVCCTVVATLLTCSCMVTHQFTCITHDAICFSSPRLCGLRTPQLSPSDRGTR